MNLNYLKIGGVWLLKAAILVTLSAVVILLSAPKQANAATITGDLITSGGVPTLKLDDASVVSFTDAAIARQFWSNVGNQVKVDCSIRNSIILDLKSVVLTDTGEKIWKSTGAVLGDQLGGGGETVVKLLDKVQGQLIVRRTLPAVDISPDLIYGGYTEIMLSNLGDEINGELLKLAHTYGADIVAEGELDGLVILVNKLWVNGTQRK